MALYPNLNFDAEKNFVTIGLINTSASTFAGRPTLPANNFAELLRWMKEPGQNIKIGHAGVGSYAHLAGVLIAQELGVKVTQVPYRGAGPALVDLLSSEVDLELQSAVVSGQLVRDGKLKAYAVIGRNRFAGLPDLPTMGELGYKKLDIDFWHMLLAPTGTPRPIIDKFNVALRAALADARVQKTFADGGMEEFPDGRGNARGRERPARARDKALGRRDPRQPHRRAVELFAAPQPLQQHRELVVAATRRLGLFLL